MVRCLASIALVGAACAGLGGCAASRVGRTPQAGLNNVRPAANSPAVADLVERHNRNARLVSSLEAAPSVSAKSRLSGGGGGRGNMVFERDHNFRFVVEGGIGSKHYADIGSNDDEFWFWADDKQ